MPGDVVPGAGSASERPMPPVTSTSADLRRESATEDSRPLPPFFPGRAAPEAVVERAAPGAEAGGDTFPEDAFFLPDEPLSSIHGAGAVAAHEIEALADRLERLAAKLRTGGAAALADPSEDDPLDALLGGVLAGYLIGRRG